MKFKVILVLLSIVFISCKSETSNNENKFVPRAIKEVEIGLLLKDSTLNVRALEKLNDSMGIFATSKGETGLIYSSGYLDSLMLNKSPLIAEIQTKYNYESFNINFRSIARTNDAIFAASIGSPALIFSSSGIVYQENHKKAFYDSMDFWNDKEGIAIGDPTDDCMSIIITRDGGETWTKLSCDSLPKAKEGEAAFAASDTNIAIIGNKTWVATGGKASRILYSPDKGETWEVFETPIVQGKETTGMYSLDFYDEKNGFAIGGDYTKAGDSTANKIRTKDGGKTWQLVAENHSPGYRSCVQYIPGRNAKELVAIGFKGIDYSNDAGDTWKHLSDEGFYTIRFLNDSIAYAAGNKRIAKLTFR